MIAGVHGPAQYKLEQAETRMEGLCSNGQSLNEVKRRRSSRSSTVLAVRLPYASMCDVGWEYVIQLALGEQFVETCKQYADIRAMRRDRFTVKGGALE